MKQIFAGIFIVAGLGFAGLASAETIECDRNGESDMLDYKVRKCSTAGCTVTLADPVIATIPQTAVGVKPSAVITLTGSGALAMTARDNATPPNESGLSVQVPFDRQAPSIPANPILR